MDLIYLDSAATTRPYQEVIDIMVDVMQNHWGNPSAQYALADDARQIVENVRTQIAEDINADPDEIIFTSGACEANSLAIQGYLKAYPGARWWTTHMEHASINKMTKEIIPHAMFVENDEHGFVKLQPTFLKYSRKLTEFPERKSLVSIGAANGEIGTIQDLKSIAQIVHDCNCIFHTDATQLYPEQRIDVKELDIDMMSVSAQKFHGPRGAGFLYIRKGINLNPIIYGSQEGGLRGGTYDTAAIAGMGEALRITRGLNSNPISGYQNNVKDIRDRLLAKLTQIPGTTLNGALIGKHRLANNINITIDGVNAEKLVTLCSMYGVYIGKGSACKSHEPEPSNVLKAIGLADIMEGEERAFNTIRITIGEENTKSEIDMAAEIITKMVERIREDE